jgi:hypothetical protein
VSTRKVTEVMRELCGLDAMAGRWVPASVLIAAGIDAHGHRSLLGVSVSLSEADVHWRALLASLQARGLFGVHRIVSDDHAGLKAAREARFPGVAWQRSQFHLQQNAGHFAPRVAMRSEIAALSSTANLQDAARDAESMWPRCSAKASEWSTKQLKRLLELQELPTGSTPCIDLKLRRNVPRNFEWDECGPAEKRGLDRIRTCGCNRWSQAGWGESDVTRFRSMS